MSSRQKRRRAQQEKLAAEILHEPTSVNLLRQWWNWFRRQSPGKQVPILALVVAVLGFGSSWFWNLVPVLMRWVTPTPDVQIGVAFHVYERGWVVDGRIMTTLAELRNLPSNCYLWQVPPRPLPKNVKIVDPHSWVLSKFRFENMSAEKITNLRMSIGPLPFLSKTTIVSATPNVEAQGRQEATHNDALHSFVITIDSLQPRDAAILSLETPMDDTLRSFLYDKHGTTSVPIISLTADQLLKSSPKVLRINAQTMFEMETEMRTGDKRISMAEKIDIKVLSPSEPEPKDESYKLLPMATKCKEGTGGNW